MLRTPMERGSLGNHGGRPSYRALAPGYSESRRVMGSDPHHAFRRTDHSLRPRRGGAVRAPAPANTDVRLTLPARPENVAVIRHVLGAFAEALRLPADLVEDMRLAVTEACTNVVRHAYHDGHPGPIDVTIRPTGDRLDLIVSDHGAGIGPSPDIAGPGLGLPLIAALADSLEIHEEPRRGSRLTMSFRCRPHLAVA
jgi:serine/threonine-protein kinase RsbW